MTDRAAAGRKAKRHGRDFELRIRRQLIDEGFRVILGGSGKTRDDLVDMVAIGKNLIRIIQAKYCRVYGREREGLLDELFNLPRFAGISRELWEYDEGTKRIRVNHV